MCDSLLCWNDSFHGECRLPVNYLVIGNVTRDLQPDGSFTVGGTVTYAARTATALGCRVAAVTSADPTLDLNPMLSGIEVARLPTKDTLTMSNVYTPSGRVQYVHALGSALDLDAVPLQWREPDIVHLAPLAGECDTSLFDAFPGSLVGVTPQGWMRAWDQTGQVRVSDWLEADDALPRVDAAVMSVNDAAGDEAVVARFARSAPILVMTLGGRGSRVYAGGEERDVPVTEIPEVDPTGAGDIFAAAFFVRLHECGDPFAAADFANRVAAQSVKRAGWTGTPTEEEIARVRQA